MGGRGAPLSRNENGRMPRQTYRTIDVFKTVYRGQMVQVKLIEAVSTGGSRDLPSYSNSPNAIYARLDQKTGRVESIRIYRNHIAFLDLDHHEGQPEHGTHWHYINFAKSEGKKRKTGRSKEHFPASKLSPEFSGLLKLLDKYPQQIHLELEE